MLAIASGIFWSLAYLLIIRRGFQDRTYGMPMAALCFNLSWEFIFSFIYPHESAQRYINIVWFGLDVIIFYQCIKFGRAVWKGTSKAGLFYPALISMLGVGFGTILFVTTEFSNWEGYYSAFGQNLLMSILFITMLLERGNASGQSLYIGISKMAGTLCASLIAFEILPGSYLTWFFAAAILVFDGAYVILLYKKLQELHQNPWAF